jgi:hypothetical protein
LSLDAPLVAVLWQGFVAACFHLSLAWPARATLALAVWAVYIGDRLLDTAKEPAAGSSPRHRFHNDHRRLMTGVLVVVLGCAAGLSLLQVRPALFHAGVLIAALVLAYMVAVHKPSSGAGMRESLWRVSKEAVVAVLFTCGTILAPWLRSESKGSIFLAASALFLVFWANTSLIEMIEWRRLRASSGQPPHASTVSLIENYKLFAVAFVGYTAALFFFHSQDNLRWFLLAPLIATLALYLLAQVERRLSPTASRVFADAALLSPIVVWPLVP